MRKKHFGTWKKDCERTKLGQQKKWNMDRMAEPSARKGAADYPRNRRSVTVYEKESGKHQRWQHAIRAETMARKIDPPRRAKTGGDVWREEAKPRGEGGRGISSTEAARRMSGSAQLKNAGGIGVNAKWRRMHEESHRGAEFTNALG